jgi:succinyl-diaminopimelate desuccinylase
MSGLVDTLSWLVNIPSPTGEEEAMRDEIHARLHSFDCKKILDSLVVGTPGPGKVVLAGHTDTVPLQGETGSRIEGGRLHGLGATDMKSGLAVMIHLIEELGTDSLVGVFYAGEEGPLSGNQLGPILNAFPVLADSSAGIVLEPTNLGIEAGCNGAVNATVVFIGEPAHSSRPWLGVNAVSRAGGFLTMMDQLEPEDHVVNGLLFREVMSITTAHGGVANNVVPGRFEMNVNYRFAPDRTLDEAIEYLRDRCSAADSFEVSDAAPAGQPVFDQPLFDKLARVSRSEIAPKQGWTDVAQLSARGIPAINFGPGESALAHKPGESVRISDLDWAFESLREVLS